MFFQEQLANNGCTADIPRLHAFRARVRWLVLFTAEAVLLCQIRMLIVFQIDERSLNLFQKRC